MKGFIPEKRIRELISLQVRCARNHHHKAIKYRAQFGDRASLVTSYREQSRMRFECAETLAILLGRTPKLIRHFQSLLAARQQAAKAAIPKAA